MLSLQNLILVCNTIHSKWTRSPRICVLLQHPSDYIGIVVFPWVSELPDISTEIMTQLFADIPDIECYMDDIGCFSNDWKSHIQLLTSVLSRPQEQGFTINPLKCEWAVKEIDFLGNWMTPTGIKPWHKKVDAILKMKAPTTIKELRSFLGLVNYYRDMWPRRTHTLAPLTALTGKAPFRWTHIEQTAFDQMKALLTADALLHYPDHNQPFDIKMDVSDYQLGAVIKQHGRLVAYYSRKLTPAQQNYTTIEKELVSIVETSREFQSLLLGTKLHVYTDHKNLTHALTRFTTQRVLCWRLHLEEYGATFHYKRGSLNFIADALSRVPTSRVERESSLPPVSSPASSPDSPADGLHIHHCLLHDDPFLADGLLVHPVLDEQG